MQCAYSATFWQHLHSLVSPSYRKNQKKIQTKQNKCIRSCLRLDKIQHISVAEFRSINWLPTKEIPHQCINAITFKFVSENCPFYLNEIFEFAPHCRIATRNSFAKFKHPSNTGWKTLLYTGPSSWNNLPETIKKTNNLNTFKHNVKSLYLNQ